MKEFTLKQVATSVPEENVQDVHVTLIEDKVLLIATTEGWIRIDLANKTFAVGAYEG